MASHPLLQQDHSNLDYSMQLNISRFQLAKASLHKKHFSIEFQGYVSIPWQLATASHMTIRITIACSRFYDFENWIKGRIIWAQWREKQERDAYMRQHSRYEYMWRCMRKYDRHPQYACCTYACVGFHLARRFVWRPSLERSWWLVKRCVWR